jgi:4-hydroxybenzoyl-CoA reductase subunit alpha
MKGEMSALLGIHQDKVRVINQHIGGGFGGKNNYWEGSVGAALLSQKTGRPVKIVFTKEEEFVANVRRLPKVLYLKTGVKKSGIIAAQEARAITNGGAYLDVGAITLYNIALALMLPLRVPNFGYESYRAYTNNPVCGPQRGHGQNLPRFAAETQLDMIAEDLGIDPVEIRQRNALQAGDVTINKMRITTCGMSDAIEEAAKAIDWKKKRSKTQQMGRGIGMGVSGFACGVRLGTLSDSGVVIMVNADGTITMLCGDADIGQGSDTTLAMIAAEVLGITLKEISVISADTSTCPFAPGTFGSRVTFYGGNAAKLAAEDVKRQLAQIAARKFGVSEDELIFKDKAVWVKGEKGATLAEIVRAAQVSSLLGGQGVIVGKGSYSPPNIEFPDRKTQEGNIAGSYSFVAQAAEVEVDKETGHVKLLRMALGDDCGQPINTLACEGQAHGCVYMGQGMAMFEQVLMDEGKVLNRNLRDYKMPTAVDMPQMDITHIVTDDPIGPFGAKEIGEGGIVSTPAAIGNAIHDATGVWVTDLPITPEKIVKALEEKERKGGKR